MSQRQRYIFWPPLIIVMALSAALAFSLARVRVKPTINARPTVPVGETSKNQSGASEIRNGTPSPELSLEPEIINPPCYLSVAPRPVTANTNPPHAAYP